MKNRVITSIGIVITLVLFFLLKVFVSSYFFDVFIALICCLSAYEMSKLLAKMGRFNHQEIITIFPVFLVASFIICLNFNLGFWAILVGLALVLCFVLGVFLTDLCFKRQTLEEMKIRNYTGSYAKFSFEKAMNSMLGFLYPTFILATMVFLNHFELLTTVGESFSNISLFVLLFVFLIPIFTDTFSMLIGSLIGGKKLCPKISPKKTVAGAIGGAVSCIVLCASVFLLCNQIDGVATVLNSVNLGTNSIWKLLIIVLFGSVISQLGDIFESYLKRKANVKNSGKLLPGHGGILDRFDSYIFVTPFLLIAFILLFI